MYGRIPSAPPTVLLVDGDLHHSLACKQVFEARGFRVLYTHSGREALQLCAREHVDVMVADLMVADMPGLDLIGAVASRPERIPIVVSTDQSDCEFDFRLWAADAIVEKSPDARTLTLQVANLLQPSHILH